jgi:hypothetical protein
MGAAVDYKGLSRKTRARTVFFSVMILNIAMWIWQTVSELCSDPVDPSQLVHSPQVVQVDYISNRPVRYDWVQPGWYRGWGVCK